MTAVPPITFGANGFSAPSEPDILDGVQTDIDTAFGGGVNSSLETPQGQLATSLSAAIGSQNDAFLAYGAGVDPAFAEGRMQDALGRLYFLVRNPATATLVTGTCTGISGTEIPVGTLAIADDGNFYASLNGASIGVGGTVDVQFACVVTGPIECPAHSLRRVFKAIAGWDAIDNSADGVVGADVEDRYSFENRRRASVAKNASSWADAVKGAVLGVSGVTDCYAVDNPLGTTAVVGGVTLAAHSIYVAAVGGTDLGVATAVWQKKPPGCDYNGNTTVTVDDTAYDMPQPAYSVTFERPTAVPIYFAVTLSAGPDVPGDAAIQVKNAIVNAFGGGDGGPKERIGSKVYAFRYSSPVAALGSWVRISSLFVGTAPSPSGASVSNNINQYPTILAANISVTVV